MRAASEAIPVIYEDFMTAVERGDASALTALYTEDAKIFPPGSDVVSGAEALPGFWTAMLGMGIKRCSFETFEIEEHGAIAFETGRVTLYGEDGAAIDRPKYLVIWKRDGGTWRLHRDIFNSDNTAT